MAKDPAFLFYSNDFLAGTYTMTDEQVGKYIRLLCLQHQKYELTKKDMMNICKTYDKDIFSKFVEKNGLFYNLRLREEADRRKAYSESRRKNRQMSKSYDEHMETETETIAITKNDTKDENTLFNICRNLFIVYTKEKINNDYVFTGKEGKCLKGLLAQIKISVKSKVNNPQDEDIQKAFEYIIKNCNDKWVLEHWEISNIYGKYNQIIQGLNQNGKNTGSNKGFDINTARAWLNSNK